MVDFVEYCLQEKYILDGVKVRNIQTCGEFFMNLFELNLKQLSQQNEKMLWIMAILQLILHNRIKGSDKKRIAWNLMMVD